MNLDDLKETCPFTLTIAKVCHNRGISFLLSVAIQRREKTPSRVLLHRLGELTQEMQSRIKVSLRADEDRSRQPVPWGAFSHHE